ncbi:hypothetical protein F383_31806 [Gossypium arboreum]|uniref:Uncharacterized protein n=1 Tax=Gossypium arboreum TaxID=29729 RepID=A0A0B0PMD3_GOSAR|nr:hypothetical protein F383_31806 [Gossypium arboreum]
MCGARIQACCAGFPDAGFIISFFVLLVFGLGIMWACVLFCILG